METLAAYIDVKVYGHQNKAIKKVSGRGRVKMPLSTVRDLDDIIFVGWF